MLRAWLVVTFLLGCSGPAKVTGGGGGEDGVEPPPPPRASPGFLAVEGPMSKTLERAIKLYDKRDLLSAMIELSKVVEGEAGDNDAAKAVASYDLGVACLELGYYGAALKLFHRVADSDRSPVELRPFAANGLATIFDRVGDDALDVAYTASGKFDVSTNDPTLKDHWLYLSARYQFNVGKYDGARAALKQIAPGSRFASKVAVMLEGIRQMMREAPDQKIDHEKVIAAQGSAQLRLSTRRARVLHEIKALEQSDRAFQSTFVARTMAEDLSFEKELTDRDCEALALPRTRRDYDDWDKEIPIPGEPCVPIEWKHPPPVTHGTSRAIALTMPPDRDGDGVLDKDDKCPDVKGNGSEEDMDNDGCPPKTATPKPPPPPSDRDGDGIPDKDDRCPSISGDSANKGCPIDKDSDGDGLLDSKDDCKTQPGPAKLDGCPDKDGDGVADKFDVCPDQAGTIKTGARAGCKPAALAAKCFAPRKSGTPAGYQCGAGKPQIGVGCTCPAGQLDARDGENNAICWTKPSGC